MPITNPIRRSENASNKLLDILDMIEVKKTDYEVEGSKEPCFEVTDGFTMVRIAKMYHYVGKDTLVVSEYVDGDYNSTDELVGDFDSLTETDAKRIAKEYSVYLEC